jgi:hypothetical protein
LRWAFAWAGWTVVMSAVSTVPEMVETMAVVSAVE